jgi:hypothetical protein
MVTAKCNRCLGSGTGSTFEEASSKIDHAVGRSRGINCGDNSTKVIEVGASTPKPKAKKITKPVTVKPTPKPVVEKPTPKPIVEKPVEIASSPITENKE